MALDERSSSLAARHDDRFKQRSHWLNQLVFAVNQDVDEAMTPPDVAEMMESRYHTLSERVLLLEQEMHRRKTRKNNAAKTRN